MRSFFVRAAALLAVLLLLLAGPHASGPTGPRAPPADPDSPEPVATAPVLRGRIVDAVTGVPLAVVQVIVEARGMGTLSRRDGGYELPLPGEWLGREVTVRAELVGYAPVRGTLTLNDGPNVVDFVLRPSPLLLDETVVADGTVALRHTPHTARG